MRRFRKLIAVATALLLGGTAFAQLSINAGVYNRNATMKFKQEATGLDSTRLVDLGPGIFIGASYSIPIMENITFAPGIYVGYNRHEETRTETYSGVDYRYSAQLDMMDVNVPLLFVYKYEIIYDLYVAAFAGPNIQYGVKAAGRINMPQGSAERYRPIDFYTADESGYARFRHFDVGFMLGGSFQFYGLCLKVGYNVNFLNRSARSGYAGIKESVRMSYPFASLGWNF